ncbi:MAG: ATP-binding protein [Bacteroidota bacterium]
MRYDLIRIYCLQICLLLALHLPGQEGCRCSEKELTAQISLTKLEDSVSVYHLVDLLAASSEGACVFLGLTLELDYVLSQKAIEKAECLLEKQDRLLQQLGCEAALLTAYQLNKAKYYHATSQFEDLSKYALDALMRAQQQQATRLEIEALKQLVWLYTRVDEDEKLWKYVKQAEQLIQANGTDDLYAIYDNRWLGYQYENRFTKTNRTILLDSALFYISIAQQEALAHQHITELTKIYRALEALAYHRGELERALSYIDTAIYYGKRITQAKNLSGLYLSKAWDHLDLGQLEEVERWTDTMLVQDTRRDIGGYMKTLYQAAELYEQSGNTQKAYRALQKHTTLKDSLFSVERLKTINDLEAKYQSALKDKALQTKDAKIKQLTIYSVTFISLLILLLLLLSRRQLKKVKRINANLEQAMATQLKLEQEIIHVRENIAQDFHDELGNKLARISLLSSIIEADKTLQHKGIKAKLQQITEDAKTLYLGTRDFIFSLKSNSDNLEEVVTYLSDFGEDYFSKTAIKFQLERSIEQDIQLPFYWSKQLIFIFKEAMTNALKHSDCSEVQLQFKFASNILYIEFQDNGKGIPEALSNSNNGLASMRKRAAKIGGHLVIDSSTACGTTISFTGNIHKNEA